MNGKTAKLLRRLEQRRVMDAHGRPVVLDARRTALGRASLPHPARGKQTAWLRLQAR